MVVSGSRVLVEVEDVEVEDVEVEDVEVEDVEVEDVEVEDVEVVSGSEGAVVSPVLVLGGPDDVEATVVVDVDASEVVSSFSGSSVVPGFLSCGQAASAIKKRPRKLHGCT
ncbi:hypothetical protein [Nannocystis punicea]|uniref:Uncharacterized protein n=1 Tax=Nannocystis punicea TaxID=2995304 RepID=A0ABY7GWZ3_9BACT|nr:hypothetical protein [Nannocystis poenicansa]WAS91477.1 hypothetical protein O0S08_35285 [Nannocystis poenicansa]